MTSTSTDWSDLYLLGGLAQVRHILRTAIVSIQFRAYYHQYRRAKLQPGQIVTDIHHTETPLSTCPVTALMFILSWFSSCAGRTGLAAEVVNLAASAGIGNLEGGEMVGEVGGLICESSNICRKEPSIPWAMAAVSVMNPIIKSHRPLPLARCILLLVSHHVRMANVRVGNPRLRATTISGDIIVMIVRWKEEDRCMEYLRQTWKMKNIWRKHFNKSPWETTKYMRTYEANIFTATY